MLQKAHRLPTCSICFAVDINSASLSAKRCEKTRCEDIENIAAQDALYMLEKAHRQVETCSISFAADTNSAPAAVYMLRKTHMLSTPTW